MMKVNRRNFLATAMAGGAAAALPLSSCQSEIEEIPYAKLDEAMKRPVLKTNLFSEPVIIETLDLLEYKNNYLCRIRSKDGAEGFSFANSNMDSLYPIFVKRLQSFFIGKNALNLESLLEQAYVYKSNYKLQSVALWSPLSTVEFAILDMLGRIANKTMGQLIGEIHNTDIKLYQANSERGISAEETMDHLLKQLEVSKAEAVKFKVGGRMSAPEFPRGRSEKLIPLARKILGDEMVISADSNGSYDVDEAIRIGKIMEEHNFDFYEEPVPFDWYEETKQVADVLKVPIAGGEQEGSYAKFSMVIG